MSQEELKKNLEELAKKYEEAMEQLKALKESAPVSSSSPVTSSTVGQKQIVVFPRDKKIKKFTLSEKKGGILVSLDFKKDFDTLEWQFIKKILELFNFGENVKRWIRIFYTNIESAVLNNGFSNKR